MVRRSIIGFVLACLTGFACFGQATGLRDYVGLISQTFHPNIVTYLKKLQKELERDGNSRASRSIEFFLKGETGTGFVYVDSSGKNYLLTNYHVISQAHTLSITFEKQEGEKANFSDLSIIAADEDMDIALLAFADGQVPFKEGLAFLNKPVQEGDDVYSAGFPGLGTNMIWQFGRGMVSNASVRFPERDDSDRMLGPYIQHTAQVDPGNSGGPLLVQAAGVPAGYAVAGINTLSARFRQAANYSIPMDEVRSFLEETLKAPAEDQKPILEARANAFIKELSSSKTAYPYIAKFLSNGCTGENAERALSQMMRKAPKDLREDILDNQIVTCMAYAVAWTIESSLRSKTGAISITVDSIAPGENGTYKVFFKAGKNNVDSVWINEYGIWRIRSFKISGSGMREQAEIDIWSLHYNPNIMISLGLTLPFDGDPAFGLDLKVKQSMITGGGIKGFFGKDYKQIELYGGVYIPIVLGPVAITPYGDFGFGLMFVERNRKPGQEIDPYRADAKPFPASLGVSIQSGLMITSTAVPGLYLQAGYQRNWYIKETEILGDTWLYGIVDPNLMYISIGYAW